MRLETKGEEQAADVRVRERLMVDERVKTAFSNADRNLAEEIQKIRQTDGRTPVPPYFRRLIEFINIGVFGAKAKPIDWNKPTSFTDEDLRVIGEIEVAGDLMSKSQLQLSAGRIAALPRPLGSKADRGELDGYSPEVLITAGLLRDEVLKELNKIQQLHWFKDKSKAVNILATSIIIAANAIQRSDYDEAFQALADISFRNGKNNGNNSFSRAVFLHSKQANIRG